MGETRAETAIVRWWKYERIPLWPLGACPTESRYALAAGVQ